MRNPIHSHVTSVAEAASSRLDRFTARARSDERARALTELGILDGVRFGVKLAVGLGPDTRFRLEWWQRLVARMQRDDVHSVVLSRAQIEWLLAQVSSEGTELASEA